MNFSIDDPKTWSDDDPALWMHQQWYRARRNLPKESSSGVAPSTEANQGPSRADNDPGYNPPDNADGVYRIEGVDVTMQELLSRLKGTTRSVSEEYFMRKNGDPLGDLEVDWYEELKPFLDPEVDEDEDEGFALWNAKQHYKLDKKIEKKLKNAENPRGSSQTETAPKPVSQCKTSSKAAAKSSSAKELEKKMRNELEMDLVQMKRELPKLKHKLLRIERACRRGGLRKIENCSHLKNDLDKIMKDIKILDITAKRVQQ